MSILAKNLIENYRCADYRIGITTNSIILRVDQHSEPLAKLLVLNKKICATIISAFNPYSQQLSNEKNMTAHELLRDSLRGYSLQVIEGLNTDPINVWPVERSFFVLGMNLRTGRLMGQQFNQNAIIFINYKAIPRLVILR